MAEYLSRINMVFFSNKLAILIRKLVEARCKWLLEANSHLWEALHTYLRETGSTGCGYIDYWRLYSHIRKTKPVEILECGTGVSTLIIAHALMENEAEFKIQGKVTSMEESYHWLKMSQKLLPKRYQKYVDFNFSKTVDDNFSLFRGVRYKTFLTKTMISFLKMDQNTYH